MNQVDLKISLDTEYRLEEAYKTLRTNLQFCGTNVRAVALTSCTPDEGKSTVSIRLGMALANSGKKTILIDADMRKSVMIGKIDTKGQEIRGLSHYLSGQATVENVICSTNVPKFYMVMSGSFPPNPAELLGSERFDELLQILRRVFDYIIIDTPPLGSVIDSAVVAKNCDGTILVVESGVISYRFAQEVVAQLQRSNTPILGVVLNKVDSNGSGRYYNGYYSRYGKYGRYYGDYGGYYGGYGKTGKGGKK